MNHFTPAEKLMHGIARIRILSGLADEAAHAAPGPYNETFADIHQLATEAILILTNLRGQFGGRS
jgi:hypothetical protein